MGKERTNTIFTISAWTVIAILIWQFRSFQLDDAYITYRYARNLSEGLGFSYNPPQVVFGTTTPLYTMILAMFSWVELDIVLCSLVLCWVGQAMVVWTLIAAKKPEGWGLLPLIGLFVILPGSYLVLGMETSLYTGVILLTLYQVSQKRFLVAALLSAGSILIRYDGIVLAGVVLLSEWAITRKLPMRSGLVLMVLIAPWFLYANWTFGAVLPNTFFAKTGGGDGTNIFLNGIGYQLLVLMFFSNVNLVTGFIASSLVGLMLLWGAVSDKHVFERLTFIWALLYLTAYSVIGLRYDFHWYYYPVIPSILIAVEYFIKGISKYLKQAGYAWLFQQLPYVLIGLPILLSVLLGFIALTKQGGDSASIGGRQIVYPLAGQWICDHSDKEATILAPEIGIIGWHCNRTIIDPYGLITPEMIPYIRIGDSVQGAVYMRPDFIVIPNFDKNDVEPFLPFADFYKDEYHFVKEITDDRFVYKLVIFEKTR